MVSGVDGRVRSTSRRDSHLRQVDIISLVPAHGQHSTVGAHNSDLFVDENGHWVKALGTLDSCVGESVCPVDFVPTVACLSQTQEPRPRTREQRKWNSLPIQVRMQSD